MPVKFPLPPVEADTDHAERCPVRDVLDCVGDRWSLLALTALAPGTLRFTELKRTIGDISPRMLAVTLRNLERDGYVSRKVHPTIPPKVEYRLTPMGTTLLAHVEPLIKWADANHDRVRKARKAYVPPAPIAAL
jgi:DNA-binding HxlR family transcriptional regulator